MAYDGNGTFNRLYNWVTDKSNAIDITASKMDAEENGYAAGLTLAVTRDGQGKMAADWLPATDATYNLGIGGTRWKNLLLSGAITANGGKDATPDSGSWSATLSGPWASGSNPSGTLNWSRQGTQVTIFALISITQTASIAGQTISISGLPAPIQPSGGVRVPVCAQLSDNGISVLGFAEINGSAFLVTPAVVSGTRLAIGTFTNSGTAGIVNGFSVTYSL